MTTITSTTRAQFKDAVDNFIPAYIADDSAIVPQPIITALTQHTDPSPRDYLMGAVKDYDIVEYMKAIRAISMALPADNRKSATIILSALNYEMGNDDLSNAFLISVLAEDGDYSLAKLLKRVYTAGWPTEMFAQMRAELHDKVNAEMDDSEL